MYVRLNVEKNKKTKNFNLSDTLYDNKLLQWEQNSNNI